MYEVGRAIDGELLKLVELVHVFEALAGMAWLLGVKVSVWWRERDGCLYRATLGSVARGTAGTGFAIRTGCEKK